MNVYTTDKIRNVVLLGHAGSGKTSLAESMAFMAGLINRPGKISDGNTISDYDSQEKAKAMSVHTSLIPIPWNDCKINILDTPGSIDFSGEVYEALSVADGAIICINGKAGIESGTRRAWNLCEKYGIPRIFYVSHMDIDDVSLRKISAELKEVFGPCIAPFNFSIRENGHFVGYINVINEKGFRWNDKGEAIECDVPEENKPYLENYRTQLMEAVAETSEEYMDRFFAGEQFSEDEIKTALKTDMAEATIVPVSMGSSILNQGTFTLLSDIVKYMPSPDQNPNHHYDPSKGNSAYIFKTIVDPFVGKYSMIKIMTGTLKPDDLLRDPSESEDEKIGKLYVLCGSKPEEVSELHAGDIGALSKLGKVKTGDTLCGKDNIVEYERGYIPTPYTYMRYAVTKKGEEDKAAAALTKIMQEDLTVKTVNDAENHQSLIYGLSEQHIQLVAQKVLEKYKVEITLSKPLIAYKETILGKSDVEYKHKKQSGGHGQYGHVKMRFSPSGDNDTAYTFTQSVVGGSVPKNFFPAVEKGIVEGVARGPLAGYPVVGVAIDLYDGSYHPVDSSEQAFKTAAIGAFKDGIMQAKPVLLEPIAALKVICPDENTGDVMGDLNKRHARVNGSNALGDGTTEVDAHIPYADLYGFGTDLRSMTGGNGDYSYDFYCYQQTNPDVQAAEVERRKKEVEALD